jgi:hypothetical protein
MHEWLTGLVAGMRLGHLKVKACSIFLLSQIALGSPRTAARIVLLDGLTEACAACCSAEVDATLTMNTGLLINNLAALGGEEAVRALTADNTLIQNLTRLLDLAQDAPTLQRLTGVFNHLSRSEDSAKCLHALCVMAALRRVTERPHVLILANMLNLPPCKGSLEAQQVYVALATMAMANISVRQETSASVVLAHNKPALKMVVHFLRCHFAKRDLVSCRKRPNRVKRDLLSNKSALKVVVRFLRYAKFQFC